MTGAQSQVLQAITRDAARDLTNYQYHAMQITSSQYIDYVNTKILPGTQCIGVLQNAPAAANAEAEVALYGTSLLRVDGATVNIVAGDCIGSNSNYHGEKVNNDGGPYFAIALEPSTADNDLIEVMLFGATRSSGQKRMAMTTFTYSNQPTSGTWESAIIVPDNAIITRCWIDILTTFAGNGDDSSTIAVQINGANDLILAVAIKTGTPWDAGLHDGIPQEDDPATYVKLTADRSLDVVVAIAATDTALTAGQMNIYIEYAMSA